MLGPGQAAGGAVGGAAGGPAGGGGPDRFGVGDQLVDGAVAGQPAGDQDVGGKLAPRTNRAARGS